MSASFAICRDSASVDGLQALPGTAHCFDPLQDARWEGFLQRHPRASLFHSTPWLYTLSNTYGYRLVAYTTSPASRELENAIVFAEVDSWLTGRRLVSLSFSDHCDPLVDSKEDAQVLASALEESLAREHWKYIEFRPLQPFDLVTPLQRTTVNYRVHKLDLRPSLNELFHNMHESSTQRKIRRAEREDLVYSEGSSEEFLDQFYRLFLLTRRRQKLPPQPKAWFANLKASFGPRLKIRLASKNGQAVASIVTIAFKDTMSYKYGACDERYNNLGSMHLLLWKAIEDAKANGLTCLDFGRTNADQDGLITFKNRWGAAQSVMTYSRFGRSQNSSHFFDLSRKRWKARATKYVLGHLPSRVNLEIGQRLYRHVG